MDPNSADDVPSRKAGGLVARATGVRSSRRERLGQNQRIPNGSTRNEVLLDNPLKHWRVALAIPRALRIYDSNRPALAYAEAVRLRSEHATTPGKTQFLEPPFQVVPGVKTALFIAALGVRLIATEENMPSGGVDAERDCHTPLAWTTTFLGSWPRHGKRRSIARTRWPDASGPGHLDAARASGGRRPDAGASRIRLARRPYSG